MTRKVTRMNDDEDVASRAEISCRLADMLKYPGPLSEWDELQEPEETRPIIFSNKNRLKPRQRRISKRSGSHA